jgi:hypothetical protein
VWQSLVTERRKEPAIEVDGIYSIHIPQKTMTDGWSHMIKTNVTAELSVVEVRGGMIHILADEHLVRNHLP